MKRQNDFQVLVAGAGPVGMMAALELARKGVKVCIVDKDEGITSRSYACVLHATSVRLLSELGLADALATRGTRVEQIGLAEDSGQARELSTVRIADNLSTVILPQSDLEEVLQEGLAELGVEVQWQHRLADLQMDSDGVYATIHELRESGKGYAVPHLDRIVRRTFQCGTLFVIGADGQDSHVRELAHITRKSAGGPQFFAAYEFEMTKWANHDLFISLREGSSNLFARLPNGRACWITECAPVEVDDETHSKDRLHFRIVDPVHDGETLRNLNESIQRRAAELNVEIGDVQWHGIQRIERSLVTRFGNGRCWLVGDAAHVASPIGMHSLNLGLAEAVELAGIVASEIETGNLEALRSFDEKFQREWEVLFGSGDSRKAALAQALPATGADLTELLKQREGPATERLRVSHA